MLAVAVGGNYLPAWLGALVAIGAPVVIYMRATNAARHREAREDERLALAIAEGVRRASQSVPPQDLSPPNR